MKKSIRVLSSLSWRSVIAATVAVGFQTTAWAASFDCAKASSTVESLVCSDRELSGLDEDIVWFTAHIAPSGKAIQKQAQRKWLRQRNACADTACLRPLYIDRARVLARSEDLRIDPRPGDPPGTATFTLKNGWITSKDVFGEVQDQSGDPLCTAAAEHMNRYAADWSRDKDSFVLYNFCSTASLSIPGMSSPPWEKLDPSKHMLLISKLLRLGSENAPTYFSSVPRSDRRDDAYYQKEVMQFIQEGGLFFVWRAEMFPYLADARSGEFIDTRNQQQTIVQLRQPDRGFYSEAPTPSCRSSGWIDQTFLVEKDLSEPLPIYIPELSNSTFMLFNNKPVFIANSSEELSIYSGVDGGYPRCNLTSFIH